MKEENKTILGGIFIVVAGLVAVFGIMASCSINVARVDGQAQIACLNGGGEWVVTDPLHGSVGSCIKRREPRK